MRFAVQIRREIRMCNDDPSSSSFKKTNYRVRFRHNVCPTSGPQVTRADIKKYDYFFETGQEWVDTRGDGKLPATSDPPFGILTPYQWTL